MSEVASQFLVFAEGDPRRELLFELLHGVRAQPRLLQWELDIGASDLADQMKADFKASKGARGLMISEAMTRVGKRFSAVFKRPDLGVLFEGDLVDRMERAYLDECEAELSTVSNHSQ